MDVRGPDGKIVRFPDGTDAGKIDEVMSSIYTKPKAAPRSSGLMGQLARQAGLAARYVPEGLADLAGVVTNPLNTAINTGLQAFGSKARIGTDLGAAASGELDKIGLPKPRGGVERVVGDASRAMVGAVPFIGAGNVMAKAASPIVRGVGQALAAAPSAQAGYGALGAGSAGTAREAGLPVPLQVAAGLGIPLAANAIGPRAVNAMRTLRGGSSPKRAAEIAQGVISDALAADNISPNLAGQVVSEANARGVPLSLMDVGPNTRGLASGLARKPGASRTLLNDTVGPRQASAPERIRDAMARNLGPINNTFNESDALIQGARAKAEPFYKEAYSQPPVVSPEIESILKTPAARSAIRRAETIAANERADPKALGFQIDVNGDVVLSDTASLADNGADLVQTVQPERVRGYTPRALHYVKRGLDSVLESQRDSFGKLNKSDDMIRTTDNVRKQLLSEIDRLNPAYKEARAIYAGPAAANEALWKGKQAISKTADEIERTVANMSEFERGQYANGLRAAMADAIDKSGGSTDIVNKLLGTPAKRKALAKVFGGEGGLNNFIKTMADEKSAFETFRRISLGSPTAANLADDAMVQDGALSNTFMPAAGNLLMGRPRAAIGNVLEGAKDAWRFGIGNTAQEARNQAAALLSDTNGSALRDVLAKAMRQKAIEQTRLNAVRRSAIVGGSNTRR